MKVDDISLLKCLECGQGLRFVSGNIVGDVIQHGLLTCDNCTRCYPIINEVGIFFSKDKISHYISEYERNFILKHGYEECMSATITNDTEYLKQVHAAKNWEYQWSEQYNYSIVDFQSKYFLSEEFFYKCIPLSKADITGKVVCIVCAGKGREAYNINRNNPEKIICCELGDEIYSIKNIIESEGLVLCKSDAMDMVIKDNICDVVICDHALQHVLDHKKAFSEMARICKNDGNVVICVYSHENNFLMTTIVEPAKIFLHKMPLKAIEYFSVLPAVLIFALIKMFYIPINNILPKFSKLIPLNEHMIYWSNYDFKTVWTCCFDLMHAPISYHFKKTDVLKLAETNGLSVEHIENVHGTTWTMNARKA